MYNNGDQQLIHEQIFFTDWEVGVFCQKLPLVNKLFIS